MSKTTDQQAAAAAAAADKASALAALATETATKLAATVADTASHLAVSQAVLVANVENIKTDITDIKGSLKSMIDQQDGKLVDLGNRVDGLSKTVYIGIGIATTFAFAIPILIKFFTK